MTCNHTYSVNEFGFCRTCQKFSDEAGLVSSCCGASDRSIGGDTSFGDMGFCPECREHCDFVECEPDELPEYTGPAANEFVITPTEILGAVLMLGTVVIAAGLMIAGSY